MEDDDLKENYSIILSRANHFYEDSEEDCYEAYGAISVDLNKKEYADLDYYLKYCLNPEVANDAFREIYMEQKSPVYVGFPSKIEIVKSLKTTETKIFDALKASETKIRERETARQEISKQNNLLYYKKTLEENGYKVTK